MSMQVVASSRTLASKLKHIRRFLFIFGFEVVVILDWGIVANCLKKVYLFLLINVSYCIGHTIRHTVYIYVYIYL